MSRNHLHQNILAWANNAPQVRALIEVGAGARRDHPADEWSDIDFELYLTDTETFAAQTAWFEAFAPVWVYLPLHVEGGFPSRLVIYEGGLKVDFVLFPLDEPERRAEWQTLPPMYQRGYLVHLDKDGLAARIPPSTFGAPEPQKPTAEEFDFAVREFWFEAWHIAKYLRRDDLWSVQLRNRGTRDLLLQMMEWHAAFVNGRSDTWHDGRFLKEWTDAETWEALHDVFPHFDAADSWHSLLATMRLYRRLSREIANSLGYLYPEEVDRNLSGYIEKLQQD